MKIAIVTDSTAYLSQEEVQKYGIHVVPITVNFENHSYQEGVNIDNQQFYQELADTDQLPTTAQPSVGQMLQLYDHLAEQGYDAVISIHLASTISGLYNQLCSLAPTIKNIKVIPYDSKITVKLMGMMVIYAAQLVQKNTSLNTIIEKLDDLRQTIDEVFVVDDLKNLVKGGRLSNAAGFMGSLLNIKPLLTFDDQNDQIVAFGKVRSTKRALLKAESIFKAAVERADYPIRALIINGNDPKRGQEWTDKIQSLYPKMTVEQSYFGPVIGTHLGNKALALGWMRDFEKV